ncbi:hypothetical protein HD806DRAFT_50537 [Xylariaceae sp. AK1471]|nr:hypothetical protein HD806DRAFT_50537 [Xylariaceae sp. AK1471]
MDYTSNWNLSSKVTEIFLNVREQSNTSGAMKKEKPIGLYAGIVTGSGVLLILLVVITIRLLRSDRRMKRVLEAGKPTVENADAFTELSTFHQATFSLSIVEKLGVSGILVMSLPLLFEITSLGFLSTFWNMPAQASNETIRKWIADGKLPTIIAIVSLVIRLSKGSQTALALSMIASIALEGFHIGVADIPALMIQRSNSTASSSLPLLFLRKAFAKTKSRQSLFLVLLQPLAILSYATEFTSTLLLSDFGSLSMKGYSSTQPIPVGFDAISVRGEGNDHINYAGTSSPTFPPFAEHSDGTARSDFIDYTGVSLRAFLPLSSLSSRQSLRNFSGYVTMIDATTLCIRPRVLNFSVAQFKESDNLAIIKSAVDYPLFEDELRENGFNATTFFDNAFHDDPSVNQYSSSRNTSKFAGAFNCTILADTFIPQSAGLEMPSFLCSLGGVRAFAFVNLNVTGNTTQSDEWWKVNRVSDLRAGEDGPWSTLAYNLTNATATWSISLCSTIIEPQFEPARIWSESPLDETLLVVTNSSKDLNTTNLLQWSGASNEEVSLRKRGVQVLGVVGKSLVTSQPYIGLFPLTRPLGGNPLGPDFQDGKTTYWLCEHFCSGKYENGPAYLHPVYSKILRDSLAETPGPAKALRAFWTMIYQAYYYDNILFFNLFSNSTYTSWTTVLAPVQWHGFIVVAVLTITHLLLVYGIFVYFLWRTKYSKLHDPWWAYTQTCRGELADVLEDITLRAAKDPAKMLRKQGRSQDLVGLDIDILGRAVGLRKRTRKMTGLDSQSSDSD